MKKTEKKCVLCGQGYSGWGNNAQPLANGECCDTCNEIVIAVRIQNMFNAPFQSKKNWK